MSEKQELKIDSTLWATPTKLVNLLDFIPNKLSVQTQSDAKSSINVRYLNMLFVNNDQQMRYNQ